MEEGFHTYFLICKPRIPSSNCMGYRVTTTRDKTTAKTIKAGNKREQFIIKQMNKGKAFHALINCPHHIQSITFQMNKRKPRWAAISTAKRVDTASLTSENHFDLTHRAPATIKLQSLSLKTTPRPLRFPLATWASKLTFIQEPNEGRQD